jgi:hypothetical protein
MRRLIRRRLSKALGTQAQLVSLQADQISGQPQGYCTAQGRLSRFRFSAGGRLLLLKPLLNLFRWDRSAA